MKRAWGQTTEHILALLASLGPMTRSEICRQLGLPRKDCAAIVTRLMKPTQRPPGPRRLHIVAYVYDEEGQRRYPRAVYALGDGPDARCPGADTSGTRRRYREARKLRVASVFHLGLTRKKKRQAGYRL